MKIGTLILCRYSSSRLPGKILMEIDGIPILQHIYNRLTTFLPEENIAVATSVEASDDRLEAYCKENNIQCYRGDLNNVAGRFLEAAKHFGFDYVTRINGDNLFLDKFTYQEMLEICKTQQYDFITNVKDRTFPYGMSIEILKTDFYESIYQSLDTDYYKEHVTIYLYENPDVGLRHYFYNHSCPEAKGLKLAVDEPADFEKAVAIMAALKKTDYEFDLKRLYQIIESL